MNNYSITSKYPSAHLTKKKSRLKIYNGNTVFLDDGDFFEFELYNPKHVSVLCKIKINGNYISESGLVLKPGQRVFLERFLDKKHKFQFNTYDVEDNRQNRDAIAFNGDVEILFFDEQQTSYYPSLTGGDWTNGWTSISTGTPYYGNVSFTTSSSSDVIFTSNSSNIETGRVEMGDKSRQELENTLTNFKSDFTNVVKYKILPYSQKKITTDDIRNYCSECGKKLKKEFKFCPSCGNKI